MKVSEQYKKLVWVWEENAELREALKSLHQSVLNVQLRGAGHVPSVRDRQSAMRAATKLLNQVKGE